MLAATMLASVSPAQGAGGKYGGRGRAADTPVAKAVAAGLEWLRAHQDEDGRFSASQFVVHDPKTALTDGVGGPDQDMTVTALSLLAFLGNGNTANAGPHADAVKRATAWLRQQQRDDGFLGDPAQNDSLYGHALACYALAESAGLAADLTFRDALQNAMERLVKSRLADGGWARRVDGKTSDRDATLAAALAIHTTRFFRFYTTDVDAVPKLMATQGDGKPSSAEAVVRFFNGEDPNTSERLAALAKHLAATPMKWPAADAEKDVDLGAWYEGTMAAYQFGGNIWKAWSRHLEAEVLPHQRQDGSFAGSWDPIGPRGKALGRVGSTALLALTCESYNRYTRLVR